MQDTSYILAVTTLGDEKGAATLSRRLLERRLVACVNIVSGVRSLYRWKGSVEDEAEHVLLMKTRADAYEELAAAVSELHPYEVPELIVVPIERGSDAYLRWIDDNVVTAGRSRSDP